jgi:putative pyruvate formate lyase activating enzyme
MISGCEKPGEKGGSGTIFFTGCNSQCVFCQNWEISRPEEWKKRPLKEYSEEELWGKCRELIEERKVHNINLVSPTPYSDLILDFLKKYRKKIHVPVIWNSNGYERAETLKKLEGFIDVYLPDLKYFDNKLAIQYSKLPNYFEFASQAILEMWRQVGAPKLDGDGFIKSGLIIRHLVLPEETEDSKKIIKWVYDHLGPSATMAIMSQYVPIKDCSKFPKINRRLTEDEYNEVVEYFLSLGFEDGLAQELSSADHSFTPKFL